MLEGFGFGGMSPGINFLLMPVYADVLRMQAIEFNDQIRKSAYSFELRNNELKLFPRPHNGGGKVWFQYYVESDRNNPLRDGDYGAGGTGVISDYRRIDQSGTSGNSA